MSYVRSDGYSLKDRDDDAAFQCVVGDLQRLALGLYKGTKNAAYTLTPTAAAAIGAPPSSNGALSVCRIGLTGNYQFVSNADTIIFNSKIEDSQGAYNTATGVFTAPASAVYSVSIGLDSATRTLDAGFATTISMYYPLYKNGSTLIARPFYYHTLTAASVAADLIEIPMHISVHVSLSAGDTLAITGASSIDSRTPFYGLLASTSYFSASWPA